MHVLYILDYGTVGGATRSFIELVSTLKEMGVQPVVCTGNKNELNDFLDKIGILNIPIGHKTVLEPFSFIGWRWPKKLFNKIKAFYVNDKKALNIISKRLDISTIDLIHTNSARNDIGCLLSKKYKIPHIMHIREFADLDFNCISFRPNYIQLFNKYTNLFIAISEAVKNHWIKKGIYNNHIKVVYNGIHYEDITVSTDEDKQSQILHLLIAGGVFPTKGQHLAVEAIGYLPPTIRNNVELDIMGWYNENYVNKMKFYAECRGYGMQIRFLGPIDDLHHRLGDYQIGLMCSRAEGFGRVTAEYMHARLCVIASNSGANPELIEDGKTGLLFESGDPKSLSECILKVYRDREILIRLSNAAQIKARELYTQKKNAENIYNLYRELLNV